MRIPFMPAGAGTILAAALLLSCKSGPGDADIQQIVSEKASAIAADGAGISSTVKDGVVTLHGSFKDEASREAFETTVKAIPGVHAVVNKSRVATPLSTAALVAGDEMLTRNATAAIRDFPSVTTSVQDSVITLTGEISKASLPKLMTALHALKPKKINNQLTAN